ncbi:MAG: PAS domain-containing protein [Rhizobiales bacterium]|nr:PAS domain-containing protein [Hyphomicrobiales bacterium]
MILNAMASSVLVVTPSMRVVFVNPAAEQLLGVSRTMLRDTPLQELMPEDSPLLDRIRRVQIDGSSVSDYSVELPFAREARHLLDLHVSPLAERPDDVLVLLHPCSVAHRLNHQLSHRGRARSVAVLGATLAHEVKNPLSGIRGAAQLLEPEIRESERPLVRLICDETDRICALVDQMEQFADLRPLTRGPVNIYEVLERVRRLAETGFARRVRFVERYDPSLPEVDGDRDQLVQVFLNLVKNAAEAVPAEDGEIILTTQYHHGLSIRVPNSRERVELPITVRIQDNGPGVNADVAAHIFEPFISTKHSGSGLGLPLVAKIVGDHGGILEFENLTKGALFRVHLPAYRTESRKADQHATADT